MSTYESRRQENIDRNRSLVQGLGLHGELVSKPKTSAPPARQPAKRRKLQSSTVQPTRVSARLASASTKPVYTEDGSSNIVPAVSRRQAQRRETASQSEHSEPTALDTNPPLNKSLEALKANWTSWTPSEGPPTRDDTGTYHFTSHPDFTPNKSPESIIREGSFGGSYWRPLYSQHLQTTIADDWRELPEEWTSGLVEHYLISGTYDPEINKYGVACGQSIEQWEANGWIAHEYDVRGWFQWFCRFWLGRRCDDDGRQISRWRKCVGETGRWRRTLLKKYVQNGIRSVTDEGDEFDDRKDPSPVVHQTCHHWAWELRQEELDRYWSEYA
ncbi:hypothetical protein GGR57DRAFT_15189 [Xylariaceae sp. FL1272]|nr:hypothetical protein GGR57DRAFT_15189 [Xylariaceae sp. FL1272]